MRSNLFNLSNDNKLSVIKPLTIAAAVATIAFGTMSSANAERFFSDTSISLLYGNVVVN